MASEKGSVTGAFFDNKPMLKLPSVNTTDQSESRQHDPLTQRWGSHLLSESGHLPVIVVVLHMAQQVEQLRISDSEIQHGHQQPQLHRLYLGFARHQSQVGGFADLQHRLKLNCSELQILPQTIETIGLMFFCHQREIFHNAGDCLIVVQIDY